MKWVNSNSSVSEIFLVPCQEFCVSWPQLKLFLRLCKLSWPGLLQWRKLQKSENLEFSQKNLCLIMLLEKVWLLYLCISLSFFSAKRKTHDECGCLIRFRPSSSLVTNAAAQWKMHKCMSIPEIPKKLESTTFHRRPGSFSESFLSFILVNFCHKLVTLEKFPLQIRKLFKTH